MRTEPGTSSAMSAIWVRANSTSSRTGAGNRNGSCCRPSAAIVPSRIRRHATDGATLRAANRPTACLTITVSTPAPSRSRASAASAWSPLTSATGTPYVPANAALSASSPTGRPPIRASCTPSVYVWSMTA